MLVRNLKEVGEMRLTPTLGTQIPVLRSPPLILTKNDNVDLALVTSHKKKAMSIYCVNIKS